MTTFRSKHPEDLRERVRSLPDRPGVYLFRDESGEILYVGKAKSLRSRVRNYFGSDTGKGIKLRRLQAEIDDLESFVVDSEAEALLLESNLIKEHSPRYNIQLRDDKTYPYIKVTVEEPFPRVTVTRRLERDGSRYFGPFTEVGAMRRTLRMIKKIYKVRTCSYDLPEDAPDRPCLDYHIGRCEAPCVGYQDREDYREALSQVVRVLEGHSDDVRETVRARMEEASAARDFERAAELRDVLKGLRSFERRRAPVDFRGGDRDVVGIACQDGHACGVVLRVRDGRLLGRQVHHLQNVAREDEADIVGALVKGFYLRQEDLPPELVVPAAFEDQDLVEEYLSLRRDGGFRVHVVQRGRKRRLVDLARENARHLLGQRAAGVEEDRGAEPAGMVEHEAPGAARSLMSGLDLDQPPRAILCFDVSTLGGTESVGSAVWLEDGRPVKDEYRRFRIESVPEGETDDYAMMHEIVGRYFNRRVREGRELPDLVLVDGGNGQLGAAAQALESAGAGDLPLAALAKRREEIFLPGRSEAIRLSRTDPGIYWLQRARDEAHRFALTYSRTLRKRRTLRSRLSEVPGVGAEREQELLRRFGSLEAVREASEEELREVSGIGPKTARRIRTELGDAPGSGEESASAARRQEQARGGER